MMTMPNDTKNIKRSVQQLLAFLDAYEQVLLDSELVRTEKPHTPREITLLLDCCRSALLFKAETESAKDLRDLLPERMRPKYAVLKDVVLSRESSLQPFLEDAQESWRKMEVLRGELKRDAPAWQRITSLQDAFATVREQLAELAGKETQRVDTEPFNPYNLIWDEQVNAQVEIPDMREEFMDDLFDELTKIRANVSGMTPQELASSYCVELCETYAQTSGCLPSKALEEITRQVGDVVTFVVGEVDYAPHASLHDFVLKLIYRE